MVTAIVQGGAVSEVFLVVCQTNFHKLFQGTDINKGPSNDPVLISKTCQETEAI